eukprot:9466470-Pyramimonas_sp.AAC.1
MSTDTAGNPAAALVKQEVDKRGRACFTYPEQSHAGSAGIFSRRANHGTRGLYLPGPITRRKRGYILTTGQSWDESALLTLTNHIQEAR